MSEIGLTGCRSTPIGSYLKAIGVLRVIAEQVDARARGHWCADEFQLETQLNTDELIDFFVDHYVPTPLLAPWNGRSGFRDDVNREAEKVLGEAEQTKDPRLEPLRDTIAAGRIVYARATASGWDPKKDKERWVEACRAVFPDLAVSWLDTIVVLTDEGAVFPPLVGGSGGVLGNMDLSSNFVQRILELVSDSPRLANSSHRKAWLRMALLDDEPVPLPNAPFGQFDPGRAGENRSTPLGQRGKSIVNPWDYVLCLEGALLFASSAARRLGMDGRGRAAIPFTVDVTAVGFSTSEDEARGSAEIWAPIWTQPTTLAELERLLGEGRSQWGRRQARTGLDFARAAASLGVDRGIGSFVRHAVVERFGQSKLVVPVGRIDVNRRSEVPLLHSIDRWTNTIRRARERPAAVTAALNRLDAAQYDVALRGGPERLNAVLCALAELEASVGVATTFREKRAGAPIQPLAVDEWLMHLDDGSVEFRVASGLASLRDRWPGRELSPPEQTGTALSTLLRPVRLHPRRFELNWTGHAPVAPGLGSRPLVDVLLEAHKARILACLAPGHARDGEGSGLRSAFDEGRWMRTSDAELFARGLLDDKRVARLLRGLLLLDWRRTPLLSGTEGDVLQPTVPLPAWALLSLFYLRGRIDLNAGGAIMLTPEAAWVSMLGAGRVREVASRALMRLRVARMRPLVVDTVALAQGVEGPRLAASLLLALSPRGVGVLLQRVATRDPDLGRSHM